MKKPATYLAAGLLDDRRLEALVTISPLT